MPEGSLPAHSRRQRALLRGGQGQSTTAQTRYSIRLRRNRRLSPPYIQQEYDKDRQTHETFEKNRGRLKRRTLTSTTVLNGYLDWPDVGKVCRMVRETTRNGEETTEVQYALTSVRRDQANAQRLSTWWRRQWEIENGLHWVRDVTLGEDASRIRTGDAPQNMAAIRNAIISCFRVEKIENIVATIREYTWNPLRLFTKLGRWIN